MKKNLIFLLLSLLSTATMADNDLHFNLINLSAKATTEVSNDELKSRFQVIFSGSDPAQLSEKVNQQTLKALKIAKSYPAVKVKTSAYTTQPIYHEGQIRNWQATQQIMLNSAEFAQMSKLLGELQTLGNIQSIEFSISDKQLEITRKHLLEEVIGKFQNQSQVIQQQFNANDYRLVNLSVNQGYYSPRPFMDQSMMRSELSSKSTPVALEAGSNEVTMEVQGQIQLITDSSQID